MNGFDVRVYAIRHRTDRRRPFEVRWHAAGRTWSRSFITRALADSYRAELVRAARLGLEFGQATGEPLVWAAPQPVTTTWYQHAVAYVDMKWQHDYHLVKQAIRQGLVVPSGRMQDKLRDRRFLTPAESLALRQATLAALLQVAEASEMSTAVIDNVYWLNGRVCDEREPACPECPFEKACLQRVVLGRPLELTRYY
jgi:hypothetical protein